MYLIELVSGIKERFRFWRIMHRKKSQKDIDARRREDISRELDKLIGYNKV